MGPIPHETWRSFLRSPPRKRLLLLITSLGEAYLGQLARILQMKPNRILALMYGAPPSYSKELGVHTLGLIEEISTLRGGRAWRPTSLGRRKARSVAAASARRAESNAARRNGEKATGSRDG